MVSASSQIIIGGFLLLILIGAGLLCLPAASAEGTATSFRDALFTSVSATCVTGLVTLDTATHWSFFGQAVILVLIQIGGMGVVTIALAVVKLSGRKIGLRQRSTMQESISAPQVGGIVRMTGFIVRVSAVIEGTGALLLCPVFIRDFGVGRGIWYSFFHSISAFCNAGFDLLGVRTRFSSLLSYGENVYVNVIVMLLIILGGISFMTWDDVRENKFRLKKYSLQSKLILLTSAVLILVPAIVFFFAEYGGEPIGDRVLHSLFQSVTTRTAGFNTADLSTKTTTIAVLFAAAVSVIRRRNDVETFKRRIPESAVRNAGAILFIYLFLFSTSAAAISLIEGLPLIDCLFETGSAVGTVGLTLGLTPALSTVSLAILMALMFLGRVGVLTLIYAALPSGTDTDSRLPQEKISIG